MTFTPITSEAEREFRRFMDAWREKHSPSVEQESEMVYRVFPLVAENLEQMTRQANAVVESLHILSTSNRPKHGRH